MCIPFHIRRRVSCLLSAASVFLFSGCVSLSSLAESNRSLVSDDVRSQPEAVRQHRTESSERSDAASAMLPQPPGPFRWQSIGTSSEGRPIEAITIGSGPHRVLVIGSIAGNDRDGILLTEAFARHLHENSLILGGATTTIIRTPNPDAEAAADSRSSGNRLPLNRQFPIGKSPREYPDRNNPPPEVQLILELLKKEKPDTVIHLRTYPGSQGVVAASSGAAARGRDLARWHSMKFIQLPGPAVPGTLERYLSAGDWPGQIITFAVPQERSESDLWQTYGDSLLNLLLPDDFESRSTARSKSDRRTDSRTHSYDR